MHNSLKKELAFLTGLLALASFRSRSPVLTGLLAGTSAGLFLTSMARQYNLRGRNVYITGGSRGLGLSIAWNALDRGAAAVTLVARDEDELLKARDILQMDYPLARLFLSVCDITNAGELSQSLEKAIDDMGGIDLLVNNAGSILVGPFTSMEKEDFEAQMRMHVYAVIDAVQMIFPHFKMRGGGRILNICSLGGKVAVPHMLPYDTSKFALAGLSQGLSAELAEHHICVTTAYPTVMRTGSPIQAVFKGNHEKEFEWFQSLDNLPVLSMSADVAAKKVLNAVCEGQTEVILSVPAKMRMILGVFLPETMNSLMSWASRLLPNEDSTIRKTGAESNRLFEKSLILSPLRKTAQKEEAVYNQTPHRDAEFNMGLKH